MIPSILSKFEMYIFLFHSSIYLSDSLGSPGSAIEGCVTAHPIRVGSQVNVIVLRPTGQVLICYACIKCILYIFLLCTHKWSTLSACEVSIYQSESVRVVEMSGGHRGSLLHLDIRYWDILVDNMFNVYRPPPEKCSWRSCRYCSCWRVFGLS